MTSKRATASAIIAAVLIAGPAVPHAAAATCKDVNATFVDVYSGGATTSGEITNGGILNGTTETTFPTAAYPTPSPTVVSYRADLTITTNRGQLVAHAVYIYDFATGALAGLAHIDAASSTGRFAGATGTLFVSGYTVGTSIPITYALGITGTMCLA
jgi:hypothetical protein